MCLSNINLSTIGTMRRTAITVYYLQMLCLLVVLLLSSKSFSLFVGAVFLSSKSCFSCWGTAFFEEFSLFVGVLSCFLRRVALHAVLTAFGFFEGLLCLWGRLACGVAWLVGLLGLWGCLACGVAWLVERWSLSLAFSVSINKLEVYK